MGRVRLQLCTLALLFVAGLSLLASPAAHAEQACTGAVAVCAKPAEGAFPLIRSGAPAPIVVDAGDWAGVVRAAGDLRDDLAKVGGKTGVLSTGGGAGQAYATPILVGTLGRSPLIDQLVASGKLDVSGVDGTWEAYTQAVVDDPVPGVSRALVIAGADKRGTIYGIYDLSRRAGVSPWVWWGDVPVPHREDLSVLAGAVSDHPEVKYRGIFLNDENPALYGWVNETFGGFNHEFYAKVFELILREKGNYLWPAMWGKAFWDDDPLNGQTADTYGVVMGTSHHEPLMRAHVEWERYGKGPWDYARNDEVLRKFWREGVERMGNVESLVTVGMRGDGDEAMTEGTAIDLLERIVTDQRRIIADVIGRPAQDQPQVWALYKEVQDYFDQGMKVPDDVTLLFADDNWGNIRRLPAAGAERPGGYGVYYHFDYVGGPRNYKWLNTSQVERTWEQMDLAWEYGARQIWIANVGDLKPMELPISFFLDYAWNPDDWPQERMQSYTRMWAREQFGADHAAEIADLLDHYTKYNARRKPELLDESTYSLTSYREFERVVADYKALAERADAVLSVLPGDQKDAFYQLVWFPIHACANLNELYYTVALNKLYAEQGRPEANALADRAQALFARDDELTRFYHEDISGGKWNHMMSQTHIGYTYWQQPDEQVLPEVKRIASNGKRGLGVAIEGSSSVWPKTQGKAVLPLSDSLNRQPRYLELFSQGTRDVSFRIRSDSDWLSVPVTAGKVGNTLRLEVRVDWDRVPAGRSTGVLKIRSGWWRTVQVRVPVYKADPKRLWSGYFSADDTISLPASGYSRAVAGGGVNWNVIRNLGLVSGAVGAFPRSLPAISPDAGSPHLEYDVNLLEAGSYVVTVKLAPSLDVRGQQGTRFAVSVDDDAPVIVRANDGLAPDSDAWNEAVSHNQVQRQVPIDVAEPGAHVVKLWLVDPGLAFEDIVVSRDDLPASYLGPPYSAQVSEN